MKISRRTVDNWARIAVLNEGVQAFAGLHPESWEFFEQVSSCLIDELGINLINKNDGPDSSRWIGVLGKTQIYFEFDDMLGTTICINLRENDSSKTTNTIVKFLEDTNQ